MKWLAGVIAFGAMVLVWIGGFLVYRSMDDSPKPTAESHAHNSLHGGFVQSVGSNHVEALIAKGGTLTVYVLGKDESVMASLPVTKLEGEIQAQGESEFAPMTLEAAPQSGEPQGTSSRFTGRLPQSALGKAHVLTLTVPIEGKLYRARFDLQEQLETAHSESDASQSETASMPSGRDADEERKLFLTPGGAYTQADIDANGGVPPSIKYKAFRAQHNMFPKKGQHICPITNTLASRNLTWIVGGKAYTFCCPPCVEEFVALAKAKPDAIKPPEFYIKK